MDGDAIHIPILDIVQSNIKGLHENIITSMETSYLAQAAEEEATEVRGLPPPPEPPHEAMFLVLAYLPLFELLVMTQVCKSLRDALSTDILPWLNIIVEKPLNKRLSDDILINITSKANGRLRTLVLTSCEKITDDGLLRVIEKNPHIRKLYVPACTSLTPEGVIRAVKLLTRNSGSCLKNIKISGIYNMKKEDLEMLNELLGISHGQRNQRRNFYHDYRKSNALKYEDMDCSIDMDICPKCDEVKMVFDCPSCICKDKMLAGCRGCYLCIPRCEECGVCVKEEEDAGEAACADMLCLECWLLLPKCNFCNKPYCAQHAEHQRFLEGSTGFLCGACHAEFVDEQNL